MIIQSGNLKMKKQNNNLKHRAQHSADAAYYVLSGAPDKTYSRGVMSTAISPRSSVGKSASRRSSNASPVETIWTTQA